MQLTIDQALQQGIEAHKAGQVQEADKYYTSILKAQPKHPDANHNMGVLAVGVGKVQEALPFFKTALEANPNTAQFWLSYIDALIKLDRLPDAKAVFNQAKEKGAKGEAFDDLEQRLLQSSKAESITSNKSKSILDTAVELRDSGKFNRAIDILKDQLEKFPHEADVLALLSQCYLLIDDIETATIQLDKAKRIDPNSALVAWNDVRLFLKNKNIEEALVIASRANKFFPEDVEGMVLLAACLRANNDLEESITLLNEAIKLNPNYAEAFINRALIRLTQGDQVSALDDLKTAHRLKPHIKQIWDLVVGLSIDAKNYNEAMSLILNIVAIDPTHKASFLLFANCIKKAGDDALAKNSYKKMLEIKPNDAYILLNLGVALRTQQQTGLAIDSFRSAININPGFAEAYYNLGISLRDQGKFDEAMSAYNQALSNKPDYAEVYNNLGIALRDQGEIDEAISAYNKALSSKPDYADAHNNMGAALQEQGKLEQAIEAYQMAVANKPGFAYAHYNLGNAFMDQSKLEKATEAYQMAVANKPDFAYAHYNLGNALVEQGKLEKAIEAYQMAAANKSDFADARYNLGNALMDQSKLEQAIEAYQMALAIKPDFADAHHNLGNALYKHGFPNEAVASFGKALTLKPDYPNAYANIGVALKHFSFTEPHQGMQKIILSLLERERYSRPQDIEGAAISLLKFDPAIAELLGRFKKDRKILRPKETVKALATSPVLLKLMSVCPITDLEFESLFTSIRTSLLLSAADPIASCKGSHFQSALALQCFTNEYIYNQNDDEIEAVEKLEILVIENLKKGQQPEPNLIFCLASYKALHEYEWCDLLTVNTDIEAVFTRQVIEPLRESQLRSTIPVLEEITNEVSSRVRVQYEANPYPRWVQIGLHLKPLLISEMVEKSNLRLFDPQIIKVEAPDILVAGCGTGQHSLDTAGRFLNSKVLAIDLSLSSLAYAKRKTEELEVKNIEYLQSDILNLAMLDRQFEIVESSGVLHHMADPRAGWTVLTQCLKKGGLMKIGLYSELARQQIVQARQEIKQSGVPSTAVSMKRFRSKITNSGKAHNRQIQNSADFFSMSSFRDLLFHVQEHRFTLPEIRDCLDELGLVFCGFEADHLIRYFKNVYTSSNDPYNLDKWDSFEQANSHSFGGMYQFWCQKIR